MNKSVVFIKFTAIALLLAAFAAAAVISVPVASAGSMTAPDPVPLCDVEADSEATPAAVPDPAPLGIAKQETTFAMLAPTTTMTFEELVGDNGVYEDEDEIPPLPSSDTYKLVVNEYWQFATVYERDESGEYTIPVRYMITTTGAYSMPTPKGTFEMDDNYVRFGLFSCGVWGQYWRQITRAFYTHSLLYSHKNPNTYTSSYDKLGTRGSHGCVRMMVPDARWIYYHIAPGTTVDIIRGDKDDEEAAAIKEQLVFADKPDKRPGLESGEYPMTEAWPGWQGNAYENYQAYIETLAAKAADAEETEDAQDANA